MRHDLDRLTIALAMTLCGLALVSSRGHGSAAAGDTSTARVYVMEEVTVAATRLPLDPFQQPYAFYRNSRQVLDDTNARTLTDRIHLAPGVFIQHTAPNQSSPFIRGLTGEQTLLLFDGVRFSHSAMRPGPNQYSALIADESIAAVDIILGSSSSVTGSDGLTGALDFRLAPPGRGQEKAASGCLRTRASSTEGVSTSLGMDGARGPWSYTIEGGWTHHPDVAGGKDADEHIFGDENHRAARIPNTSYDQSSLAARVAFSGVAHHRFEMAIGQVTQRDAPRPDGYFENSGLPDRISRFYDPQRFRYLHLRHQLLPRVRAFDRVLTTLWFHQHHETQVREDIKDMGKVDAQTGESIERYRRRWYDDGIDILGIDLQASSIRRTSHRLTCGVTYSVEETSNQYEEYRSPKGDTDPARALPHDPAAWFVGTTIPDGARYRSLGVFAQDRWLFAPAWSLLVGGRYSRGTWSADLTGRGYTVNKADGSYENLATSIRLSRNIGSGMLAFGGISQGFRAPNLTNLTGSQDRGSSGVFFQGNPDLEPETSLTVEAGWRAVGKGGQAAFSLFHTQVDDLIQSVYRDMDGDGSTEPVVENAQGAVLKGFEVMTDLCLLPPGWGQSASSDSRLSLISTTSFVRATVDVPQPDGTTHEEYVSRANRFIGQVGIRYSAARGWWAMPRIRWSADYDRVSPGDADDVRMTVAGAADGSMPGFAVADIAGGWHRGGGQWTVNVVLENLFDATYRDVGSSVDGPGRGIAVSVGTRY